MILIETPLLKVALAATLILSLGACGSKSAALDQQTESSEELIDLAESDETDTTEDAAVADNATENTGVLNLPATALDYVSYADTNLPNHFKVGNETVVSQDNTPANNPITNAGATLGRVLFYDKALSINDAISCAGCHQQSTGFSDTAVLSEGFQGGLTGRHSMSLSNNRFYQSGHYFWDERADTLEDQVLMPIQDTTEMGMTLDVLVVKLAEISYYPALFTLAFGSSEITSERISLALAQFNRAMVSYQSPYDDALATATQTDDLSHALTVNEEAGRILFESTPPEGGLGCGGCHATAVQVTDKAHNIGLDLTTIDAGAGNGEFKVPSLRNIELSPPYMHDGRLATLADVIEHYNSGVQDHPNLADALKDPRTDQPNQLNLSNLEKQQLEAFLHTLTDEAFITSELFSDPFVVGIL
jgi:cytochrome c peroxidase